MQLTPGQIFHHRWCAALANRDVEAVRELYHTAAVQVSMSTGRVLVGQADIGAGLDELFDIAGPITTEVESFVDVGDAICVEAAQSTAYTPSRTYHIFQFENGRARYHFSGTISPRPPESP